MSEKMEKLDFDYRLPDENVLPEQAKAQLVELLFDLNCDIDEQLTVTNRSACEQALWNYHSKLIAGETTLASDWYLPNMEAGNLYSLEQINGYMEQLEKVEAYILNSVHRKDLESLLKLVRLLHAKWQLLSCNAKYWEIVAKQQCLKHSMRNDAYVPNDTGDSMKQRYATQTSELICWGMNHHTCSDDFYGKLDQGLIKGISLQWMQSATYTADLTRLLAGIQLKGFSAVLPYQPSSEVIECFQKIVRQFTENSIRAMHAALKHLSGSASDSVVVCDDQIYTGDQVTSIMNYVISVTASDCRVLLTDQDRLIFSYLDKEIIIPQAGKYAARDIISIIIHHDLARHIAKNVPASRYLEKMLEFDILGDASVESALIQCAQDAYFGQVDTTMSELRCLAVALGLYGKTDFKATYQICYALQIARIESPAANQLEQAHLNATDAVLRVFQGTGQYALPRDAIIYQNYINTWKLIEKHADNPKLLDILCESIA